MHFSSSWRVSGSNVFFVEPFFGFPQRGLGARETLDVFSFRINVSPKWRVILGIEWTENSGVPFQMELNTRRFIPKDQNHKNYGNENATECVEEKRQKRSIGSEIVSPLHHEPEIKGEQICYQQTQSDPVEQQKR
jgi:hypothetical protein